MTRGFGRRPGCWPTADQDLLLRAALLQEASARDAWHAWSRKVNVQTIDEGSFRLLPLVWENLLRSGTLSSSDDAGLPARIRGVHRQSWYRNQLLFREVARTVQQLESDGVATALLKGVPLSLLYYRSDAARPMSDADILVRPRDVAAAVDVLRAHGWRPDYEPPGWPAEPRGSWSFQNRDGRELDLHWRAIGVPGSEDNASWEATEPLRVLNVETRAPGAADLLVHALVHGLRWNPVPSIRWAADAATIVRVAGEALDWDRVVKRARDARASAAVALGLGYLAQRLATPIPRTALTELQRASNSISARLSLWSKMSPGVAGAACRLWFEYRGAVREPRGHSRGLDFPAFVRRRLMIPEDRNLARALGERVLTRGRH